jgi:NADPH:quinone reductase-like Zn-dependent oxidoreductase
MRAAVVTSFDTPPTCQEFPTPRPRTSDQVLVDVIAVGLHPRVRSQAAGIHYTSTDELPLVPGIDGVGRTPDGTLRYFVLLDTTMGALAEKTVIDLRRSIVLPAGADPVLIAAAMNPAMSSWLALTRRIKFRPGQSIVVLGATGNAGQMAVQIAKHLGAARVVGTGRDAGRLATLPGLGVDETVALGGDPFEVGEHLGKAALGADVVLDYVWGQPTADAMKAIITSRADRDQPLTWIEVGSMGGLTAAIPSAALRSANLQIIGSGQGSVPNRDLLAELPELAAQIAKGTFRVDAKAVPLADIDSAWKDTAAGRRIVITP